MKPSRSIAITLLVYSIILATTKAILQNPYNATCHAPSIILPSDIAPTSHGSKVVIAHRGASAHMPEHSLEGYRLALEMGADYIEPDLVATNDGHLIAMHSIDLNITTDVAEKFADRARFSKYMNQTGYWSYQFTLDEIQTLRLKQRLPEARTQRFDGMFQIPTLTQILELIEEWNTNIEVKRTVNASHSRGVYAEIKDYSWLLQDTGHDLVDLLFQHIEANQELWQTSIVANLCYVKRLKEHEYRLPPLVIQSFEGDALKYFVNTWDERFNQNGTRPALPAPPTILLVDHDDCLEDSFWFRVEERYRTVLSGIGPDKSCLGYHWREFMERAKKSDLAVHPWTARPEVEFFLERTQQPFENIVEEILYLFCEVGVHGIFSESVDAAVLASSLPCPENGSKRGKDMSENVCFQGSTTAQFFVAFATFMMGVLIALLGVYMAQGRNLRTGRQERVPTEDVDENVPNKGNEDDLELSMEEREML